MVVEVWYMKRLLLSVLIVFSFYCNYLTAAGVLSGPAAGAGRAGGAAAAGAFSVGGASAPAAAPKTLTQAELRKKRASLRKAIVAGDEVELLDLLSHNYVLYRRYIFADKILKPTKVEETPIAMAIEACNRSALNALFEAHDPEFRSADGPTRATYYLCSLLRSENEFDLGLIRDLVEKYGADPKFEDPDGNNALGLLA
jgi:hypothetical protein